jgi:hypothetical protein
VVEGGHGNTDEEAKHIELRRGIASREGECEDGPEELRRSVSIRPSPEYLKDGMYLHSRQPVSRPDAREHYIARDFTDNVAHRPARLHVVELVLVHAQVFFPANSQSCTGKIG